MMVAYSFHRRFVEPIRFGLKRHTIRPHRKRHARPGETMQLYTGMRTKHCEKILAADPVCTRLDEVRIDLRAWPWDTPPTSSYSVQEHLNLFDLSIYGMPLGYVEAHHLAIADGFDGFTFSDGKVSSPLADMLFFWLTQHGPVLFEGVMISWEAR